jgi:hypothetical protein
MKRIVVLFFLFTVSVSAFDVEDIKIPMLRPYQPRIFTDPEYVIAFFSDDSHATAYSTKKDEDVVLRLPEVEKLKHLWIRCAATLPDGFVLGVPEGRISDERSSGISELHWGLYFYDRKGEFLSRAVVKDREILALAPWGVGTLVAAYKTPIFGPLTAECAIGLAVIDRKGAVVTELIPPKKYASGVYMEYAGHTESQHRLYREPNGFIYINPTDGEVANFDSEGRQVRKHQARLDLIPGEGARCLLGWFSVGGKNVFRVMTRPSTDKPMKWTLGEDVQFLVPSGRVFIGIHKVGDAFYKAVSSEDGNFFILRKITPENWTSLTR